MAHGGENCDLARAACSAAFARRLELAHGGDELGSMLGGC